MKKEDVNRYIPTIILLILVALSIYILKPYIVAILGAFIVTYLIYPIHKKLENKLPKWLSAATTITGVILILFIPLIFVVKEIILQISNAIQSGAITNLISQIEKIEFITKYNINLADLSTKFFDLSLKTFSSITVSVATSLVSFFVMIFIIYYLLLSWPKLSVKLRNFVPFKNKNKVISDMATTTKNIVRVTLFIAILEAIFAAIGFWLAGIDFYLILAIMIALFAFIPGGPAIVWVPALLFKLYENSYGSAIIILIFGLFISIYLDTILRTKIAGKESGIHPIIMLLGVLGATPILGLVGIVVGPLLLSYTLEILEEALNQD